jgi:aspartyl-tRNA(Asn)/glutamyl-tRNA(Gln) amidotransferase subunit C
MPVDIDIDHLAKLARLRLTSEEKERLRAQLGLILDHAAKIRDVATADVPPTASAIPSANIFRDDVLEPSLDHEAAMRNAPDRDGDRFKVVRIVETGS